MLISDKLEQAFSLLQDDHYKYKSGQLVIKKLLTEDPKKKNKNKKAWDTRLDFSSTNYKRTTHQ